jgi:hypothetical protein
MDIEKHKEVIDAFLKAVTIRELIDFYIESRFSILYRDQVPDEFNNKIDEARMILNEHFETIIF